jgi:drug/metabolite transporter (DMT)-like permease
MLAALILTGLIGMGLGNVLFTEAMRTVTASVGAAALAACPMVSLVCAALMLHEPTSAYLLAGAPLTCMGVAAAIASEPAASAGGRPT